MNRTNNACHWLAEGGEHDIPLEYYPACLGGGKPEYLDEPVTPAEQDIFTCPHCNQPIHCDEYGDPWWRYFNLTAANKVKELLRVAA